MAYVAEEGVGVMSRITMVVSLFIVFLASIVPTHVARAASETVIVPFTSGDIGVQTQNTYSGNATITVSGFGQAAGTSLSDAFYRFAEDGGSTPIVPELTTFGLLINGQLAANYLQSPPAYRSDHTYTFTIHAPGARLRFSLAVGDAFVADNSGEFVVILTGGGNPGSTPSPSEAPAGYVSRPSDSVEEDCQNRPAGVICLGFDDGYIWRVTLASAGDGMCDWDENAGKWKGHIIQVVTSCQGLVFKHIMGTDYVSAEGALPNADLKVQAFSRPNGVVNGGQLTYTVGVTNNAGPADATNVVVTATLPEQFHLTDMPRIEVVLGDGVVSLGSCTISQPEVTCVIPNLARASVEITYTGTVITNTTARVPAYFTAYSDVSDPDTRNNWAAVARDIWPGAITDNTNFRVLTGVIGCAASVTGVGGLAVNLSLKAAAGASVGVSLSRGQLLEAGIDTGLTFIPGGACIKLLDTIMQDLTLRAAVYDQLDSHCHSLILSSCAIKATLSFFYPEPVE